MTLSVTAGMTSARPMEGAATNRLAGLLGSLAESVDAPRAGAVAELQERWAQARLRVLLVGEAKRGKSTVGNAILRRQVLPAGVVTRWYSICLLYTSDAADEEDSVDLGGRRIIK